VAFARDAKLPALTRIVIVFQESDFVAFMKNPQSAPPPPPPATPYSEWGHLDGAEHLLHLTESNFTSIDNKDNVLVMFYAPCKYGDTHILQN
jgi:hypothetical protein